MIDDVKEFVDNILKFVDNILKKHEIEEPEVEDTPFEIEEDNETN